MDLVSPWIKIFWTVCHIKHKISPLGLKDSFAGFRTLGWWFFSLSTLNMSAYSFLVSKVSGLPLEKPICRSGSNRTGHGTTAWFPIGKGVRQGCILSPRLFNLYTIQGTSWKTLGWKKHKLESRLLGEISINSDMQMTPPLWQKVKRN